MAVIIAVIIVAVVHVAVMAGHQARVPIVAIEVIMVTMVSVGPRAPVITLTGHTDPPTLGQARVRGGGGGVTWTNK